MKMKKLLLLFLLLFVISCEKLLPPAPSDDELLDGPVEGLSESQNAQFLAGDIAFNDEIFTPEKGLGPYFVATSCGNCHAGDGKGHPFTTLTRFGQVDSTGNQFLQYGGPQLQSRAIPGYTPEQIPAGASSAKFTPPANTGLGFLEALTDAQILANADPNDADGDGISGVPNYIAPPQYFQPMPAHLPLNGKYIGRFGKKAGAINLLQQTVNAYNQDIGVTSEFSPQEPAVNGLLSPYPDNVDEPEVATSTVLNVVFYLRTLKAPIQRNQNDPDVLAGNQLFTSAGCAKCHTPQWTTPQSDIEALSNKTFYPYSDLLLHDMGAGLDDGYTEGTATTSEWRTPPLWGLGLSKNSQGGEYFLMHDGRARSITEAISMHGGEGLTSKNNFTNLSNSDKQKLLKFLESL
ncbi:MAG: thiol oxidoreductase [Ignavibacteriales bacterium]|nr:thiol oxidoreductase [Ignavibacteriales bacterium]